MQRVSTDIFQPSPIDEAEVRLKIEEIVLHPDYGVVTQHDSDIAVLKVATPDTPLCTRDKIWPACYPAADDDYGDQEDTEVVGWGAMMEGGGITETLRKARLRTVTNDECRRVMGEREPVTMTMICAGDTGVDTCQGDSGGPMTTRRPGDAGYALVGITSWGIGCARPDTYGVYTRVSSFLEWIQQQYQ